MADLTVANSGYATGAIDTASTLVNNVSATDAQHINGPNSAAIQIETILGIGTDLKGTTADLVARLAVEHNSDGTQKTLTVGKGGTGQTSVTTGAVLLGNGTGAMVVSAGVSEQVPFFQGSATASWTSGLRYQGPAQCHTGSTRSHEGSTTYSGNDTVFGVHFFENVTINSGVTLTIGSGNRILCFIARNSITINGTIDGNGCGAPGVAAATDGGAGTDQRGGNGGSSVGAQKTAGGAVLNGVTLSAGGSGAQVTGSAAMRALSCLTALAGGASGSGGGGSDTGTAGTGGAGGATVVLMAPTVTFGSGSSILTNGSNGGAGSGNNADGGGGGGGGNIWILCRNYVDNGVTFTGNGGSGGAGTGSGTTGSGGVGGVYQILRYGS